MLEIVAPIKIEFRAEITSSALVSAISGARPASLVVRSLVGWAWVRSLIRHHEARVLAGYVVYGALDTLNKYSKYEINKRNII